MAPGGVIATKEKENIKGPERGSTTRKGLGGERRVIAGRAVKTLFPDGKHVLELYVRTVIAKLGRP